MYLIDEWICLFILWKGKSTIGPANWVPKEYIFLFFDTITNSYYCSCEGEEVSDSFVKPDVLLQECDATTIIISNVANSKSPWPPSYSQMKNSKQLLPSTSMWLRNYSIKRQCVLTWRSCQWYNSPKNEMHEHVFRKNCISTCYLWMINLDYHAWSTVGPFFRMVKVGSICQQQPRKFKMKF